MTETPTYPFKNTFLEVEGHRIHYVELGAGDPILFLHGNPTSSYVWRDVMPAVQAATGRRCIALDLLGFGKSDKPERIDWSLALHARIVAKAVEALDLKDITLVAEDWGGPLGMHHLVHDPGRYERAVLMETFLWTFTFADDFEPKFRMPFRLMRGPLGYVIIQVMNMMTKKLIPQFYPITDEGMQYYLDSAPTGRSRRAILEFVRLNPLHGKPKASVEFIKDLQRGLAQSDIPITWLMSTPGVIVSDDHPPSQAKFARFLGRFPQVSVVPFGPGHHYLAEENPARVAELVTVAITGTPGED